MFTSLVRPILKQQIKLICFVLLGNPFLTIALRGMHNWAIGETHHTPRAAEILDFPTMQYKTYITLAIHWAPTENSNTYKVCIRKAVCKMTNIQHVESLDKKYRCISPVAISQINIAIKSINRDIVPMPSPWVNKQQWMVTILVTKIIRFKLQLGQKKKLLCWPQVRFFHFGVGRSDFVVLFYQWDIYEVPNLEQVLTICRPHSLLKGWNKVSSVVFEDQIGILNQIIPTKLTFSPFF